MRWKGHEASMYDKQILCKTVVEAPERERTLGETGFDVRTILKLVSKFKI
jgi:hypothetical protein